MKYYLERASIEVERPGTTYEDDNDLLVEEKSKKWYVIVENNTAEGLLIEIADGLNDLDDLTDDFCISDHFFRIRKEG